MPTARTIFTMNTWSQEKRDRPPMCFTQATGPSPRISLQAELPSVTNRSLASLQEVKASFSYPELPCVLSWSRRFKGFVKWPQGFACRWAFGPASEDYVPMAILGVLTALFAIKDTYFNMALDQIWTLNWTQTFKSAAKDVFLQSISKTAAWQNVSKTHKQQLSGFSKFRCFENSLFCWWPDTQWQSLPSDFPLLLYLP